MLQPEFTSKFERDIKRLKKKHVDVAPLKGVIGLVVANDGRSMEVLRQRHRMHELKGAWRNARECHVANAGDWLCVWQVVGDLAIFLRTGSHDDVFG